MTVKPPADRGVSTRYAAWSEEEALRVIRALPAMRGALLPMLEALQEEFGYVDPSAVALVANELNLSRADVHGVLTFYANLRTSPPGEVRVEVCRGEACQSVGAHALAEHALSSLGVGFKETTSDGSVTLDEVFCLGNCALGPTVRVNGRLHGRVNTAKFDELVRDGDRSRSSA